MLTFTQFHHDAADRGEAVNLVFEQRLVDPAGILCKITGPLMAEGVPHELIGGLAVLVHVEEADPEHSTLTRDVDPMIRWSELEKVTKIAARHRFRFRHAAGLDMLLYGGATSARNAAHLLFSGEKVRSNQATPIRSMDAAGLITAEAENALPMELKARLQVCSGDGITK